MKIQTKSNSNIFILLVLMIILSQFSSDIYVPAMPAIARDLKLNGSIIKVSIAMYYLSLGLSSIFYGPIADYIGRKKPIIYGNLLFILGCVLSIFAYHATTFLFARVLQGCGMAANLTLFRAVMRDSFEGEGLMKASSYLTLFVSITPPLAPILGAYLLDYFGWRSCFVGLFVFAVLLTILLLKKLPETLSHENTSSGLQLKLLLAHYKTVLSHPTFYCNVIISGSAMALILSYVILSPFFFINIMHLNPLYFSWLFLMNAIALMLGSYFNILLINLEEKIIYNNIFSSFSRMVTGASLIFVMGVVLLAQYFSHTVSIVSVLVCLFFAFIGVALQFANAFALAIKPFNHMAGTAGGAFSVIQILITAIVLCIVSQVKQHSILPLAIIVTILGLIMLVIKFCEIKS